MVLKDYDLSTLSVSSTQNNNNGIVENLCFSFPPSPVMYEAAAEYHSYT